MRKTFLKWMLVFMLGAFVAAFSISFYIQTNQASENAKNLILLKLDDVEKQLKINEKSLLELRSESDSNALAKARAFAKMIAMNPKVIENPTELQQIRSLLEVDELHVSDESGILIRSTEKSYRGYNFASDPQSAAFLPAIKDKNFELAQDPQPKGINKEIFQYVGVARIDAPGIVQIGYRPEKLSHAMQVADIKNLAPGFRVGKSGTVMILDSNKKIISAHNPVLIGKTLAQYGVDKNLFLESQGSFISNIEGKSTLFAYKIFQDYTILGQLPAEEMYLNRNSTITLLIIFNVLLFALIFILIAKLVEKVVIDGIYRVNQSLIKITEGDLNEVVDVSTNQEFKSLSQGINTMVGALKAAIKEAEGRIDSELSFAKAIQHSALPIKNLLFSSNSKFDVHGEMYTARQVGGDFYDFFMVSEDKLAFVIADVSDKGIPAALFMMVSKSLIKHYALTGLCPAEIFFKANNSLCENNSANMFVTVFMGILELKTGKLICANAGHNPPFINKNKGEYELLKTKTCLVLAGMEDVPYVETELQLSKGDRLFLYTDGVTEAVNNGGELYSDRRLKALLDSMPSDIPLEGILSRVKEDVDSFADGAEQADDITMLAIEYKG